MLRFDDFFLKFLITDDSMGVMMFSRPLLNFLTSNYFLKNFFAAYLRTAVRYDIQHTPIRFIYFYFPT